MSGSALSSREKELCPKIKLKSSATALNWFSMNAHKLVNRKKKETKVAKQKVNKDFKKQFKKLTKAEDKKYKSVNEKKLYVHCDTKDLSRIMLCFEDETFATDPINVSQITDYTLLQHKFVNDGLKFLVKVGLIKEIKDGRGRYFYEKV